MKKQISDMFGDVRFVHRKTMKVKAGSTPPPYVKQEVVQLRDSTPRMPCNPQAYSMRLLWNDVSSSATEAHQSICTDSNSFDRKILTEPLFSYYFLSSFTICASCFWVFGDFLQLDSNPST
jgi:hypothetical protein